MMDRIPADDLDSWRHHPVTEALIKELRLKRQAALEMLAGEARSNAGEVNVRVTGGRIGGYDDVLKLIAAKGARE